MSEIIKKYTNGEVTIVWQPSVCTHTAICIHSLPAVFDTKKRPWVNIHGAETARLVEQVKACPSGALSFFMNDGFMNDGANQSSEATTTTRVDVLKNGPLLIYGTLKVKDKHGNETLKSKTTAFCRCGASANKPYCDGAHAAIQFHDE